MRECDRKAVRVRETVTAMMLTLEPVNQRDVDHARGFIEGMRYAKMVVEGAENTLKKLDEKGASESEPDDTLTGDDW